MRNRLRNISYFFELYCAVVSGYRGFAKMQSIAQIGDIVVKIAGYIVVVIILLSCGPSNHNSFPGRITMDVTNPLQQSRKDVAIYIPLENVPPSFVVRSNEVQLPAQAYDSGIVVVLDSLKANESRAITIYFNDSNTNSDTHYRKRTQAELSHKVGGEWKNREYIGGEFRNVDYLRVPPEHKDHSWYLRYEGPGWESDRVGYRLYLDQRNAIDVFGKKIPDMVLMGVGQDNFDSYHNMQSWGMDIMKVGKSLGLGSPAIWTDTAAVRVENTDSVKCWIRENGDVLSSIGINHYGWKTPSDTINLQSHVSITAGSRWTQMILIADKDLDNLCTGIVKDKEGKLFKSTGGKSSWGYLATFGKQSLNNDNLGLALLFSPDEFVAFREDTNSHVVQLKTDLKPVTYHFGAAWEQEPNGIKTEAEFIEWVERSARELANPVIVNAKN